MTIYSVQGPDGRIYDIEGPEGASEGDVIAALQRHLSAATPAPKAKPQKGIIAAGKSGIENIKGDFYAGLAGLGVEGAEAKARAQKEKAAALYQLPEFVDDPLEFLKGVAGQSLPYMAAPLAAGAVASPFGALAAMGATGAASAAQFTGSNLSRQLDEGKTGAQLELGKAAAAAVPQAALDVIGFKFIPGIRTLFSKAGVPLTEEAAKSIASKYILPAAKTAGVEGATEAGQQVFERLQAGLNITDPAARKEYFDSFVGGAVLGGALSIPGTMLEGRGRPEQTAVTETPLETTPARERGEITTIPPVERGEIGVGKYRPPETPEVPPAVTPQGVVPQPPQVAPQPPQGPQPNVIDLMDQYATAQPRMEALQEQIKQAAVAGDTAKAKELYAQLKAERESLGGLKTQIEQLGGVAQTADEYAKSSAASISALDKKLKAAQKALSDAGELGDFDAVPKLADKLEKLQAERDELQATQARHNELLRVQGTPKGEQIGLFAADEAQPKSEEVLKFETKNEKGEVTGTFTPEELLKKAGPTPPIEENKVDAKAIAAKEAEAESQATELVALVKAGPKESTQEQKDAAMAEVNAARAKLTELKEASQSAGAGEFDERIASANIQLKQAMDNLQAVGKRETTPRHITEVNRRSEKLNKLYDELDALRGGKPLPTESPMALFQRDNLLRTAIANGDKRAIDILKRAQKEAEARGQRGLSEQDKLVTKMEQRLDLPGTVVERAVDDEEYDSIMAQVDAQLNKINSKQGNAKESYIQKAERLWKEMQTFEAASQDETATPHQRAMARRTFNAKLAQYETIINGHIIPAREAIYALYSQLYTKKEVGKASEIAEEKQKETDRAGREEREVSKEVKRAKKLEEGKGIKADPARVARELGYKTEEYQTLAAAAQKKVDAKVAQYNAFVTRAKQQLEKLKGKKGDPEKAEVMRKEMEAAKAVSENNPDDATLRRKYNTKKEQYDAFVTGSTVSAAYKTKEAAVVKAANEKLNALNEFKQKIADALDAKAEELGRAAPEMRSKLVEATKERKKAAAESTQEVASKRTTQETRKIAKLGTMKTGTPESQARAAAKQAVFEDKVIKPEEQARVEKAMKDVNKAPSKATGNAMKTAFTKAAQKKAEEGKFARGVEVESPDLTAEQIKHLENNDLVSALRSIVSDKNASDLNRAVAEALRGVLDNTRVELHNRLYDDKGKEVLGEAISTRIRLSRAGGLSQEVLLHEGTHAAVERTIQLALEDISQLNPTQQAAFKELRAIYNRVKADPSITSTNAKGSISEFAAEVFSNRNLQEQLRKKPWRMSNMLREFVSVVLRLLGVKDAQTMLGASLHAVDLLMMPTSAANTRVEKPVNRQYSKKDIEALHTGSNSMKQFADQFQLDIKQKDRTPEDVDRIANEQLNDMLRDPQKTISQSSAHKIDWKAFTRMPDGKQYDETSVDDFFTADPRVIAYASMTSSDLIEEVYEINQKRMQDQADLITYLRQNPDYTLAEQALVAKAASKYSVVADKNGRLKLVTIGEDNLHPVAVIGHDSANAIIEELRAGKNLKEAFIDGLQKRADRNKQLNLGKQGWVRFHQIPVNEDVFTGLSKRYTDEEILKALNQTGYSDETHLMDEDALVTLLIDHGLLPDRRVYSNKTAYDAAVALNAGVAGTAWCTGKDVGTAKEQLERGDFYIYYNDGVPEVAIRMDGKSAIGEIRGNTPNQSVSETQQKITSAFLKRNNFAGAQEYLDNVEFRTVMLDAIKTEKTLTPEQTIRFFRRADARTRQRMYEALVYDNATITEGLLQSDLLGYGANINLEVVKKTDVVFARSAVNAYVNGHFFMSDLTSLPSEESVVVVDLPATYIDAAQRREINAKFKKDAQEAALNAFEKGGNVFYINGKKLLLNSASTPEEKISAMYNALIKNGSEYRLSEYDYVRFITPLKDVKALSEISFNTSKNIELGELVHANTVFIGDTDEALILPKIKNINAVRVLDTSTNIPILAVKDGAQIGLVKADGVVSNLLLSGNAFIKDLKLYVFGNKLNLIAPDITRIGFVDNEFSTHNLQEEVLDALFTAIPDRAQSLTRYVALRKDGSPSTAAEDAGVSEAVGSYGEKTFSQAANPMSELAKAFYKIMTPNDTANFKELFDARIKDQKTFDVDSSGIGARDFLRIQVRMMLTGRDEETANKNIEKIKTALQSVGVAKSNIPLSPIQLGELTAPELKEEPDVMDAEFTEIKETPRYAPKDVGVQEDKPGIFSFKSARQEASIAPSFVAKNPTEVDRLRANFLGLTGRVQFVDQYAALSEALKKGVDSEKIKALEAEQAEYYLRFGQQRSQYAGQFLTNGPVSLVKQETKRGKEFIYQSTPGANMMQVADALAPSKIGNDTEKEAMLTALLAGERAKQVGWAKLNFDNPAKVEQEYNQVKALLNSRPQDKAMFDKAMEIYKQYNNGLLDFLVQTGTMTEKKAAELKKITYVPFYRVNKGTGEIELMVDKERPVRIGNIKDEPQLKELVGDSTQILPVFTSAVQNTFMLTEMALRNQMVKENAFMLNKIGIASTIGQGAGPAGPDTVRFKHKGEDHFVVIDTDLYDIPASLIVKGMEGIKTTMPAAIRMLGMPADMLRKFVTRNPAYAIKQAIRDPLTAWMTTGADGIPVLNSMKELASMVAGRSDAEKKLMASGAISSNVFSGDKGDMETFLKEISMGRSGWQKLMARADAFALQGDAATRAVIYRDSLNKGMSEMQAMLRTLESMNFSRRGLSPSMQMLSVLIPFFNAQIQGLDVLYRAFKGDMPYSQQLEIRKKMMARGLMLAAGTIAYAAMMEDDEAYKNAKPEERLGNWFLPTPFSDEPLRIPVPFELGYLFKSLPEAVYNMAAEDERNSDITKGMGKLVMQSNPFSLPQAIKPLTEAYLGKSFFGGDIESQREIHGMVPTERYRTGTTEIAKMMGSITGEANISPIKIDYLIRGYTGGLGIALISLANPLLNTETTEAPSKKTSQLPFIGGLFQPIEGRGTLDAAYARMLEIQQAKGTYESLMQRGKKEEAAAFREEYIDKISSASVSGTVQQKLGEIAKMKRAVTASPTLSTERKDELLKRLEAQQNNLAERFLQISDRTTRRAAQT